MGGPKSALPCVASRTVEKSQSGESEDVECEVVPLVPLLVGPVAVFIVHAAEPVAIFLSTIVVAIERALDLRYNPLIAWVKVPAVMKLLVIGT